jgi:hypothetical protein
MGLIRWFAVSRSQHRARPEDFVGKPELARFDQAEEGGRSDRLGHTGDPEQVIGSDLLIPVFVRQSIAVRIDQPALAGDGDRQSRNIVFLHERGCGRFHRPQLIGQKPVSRQAGGGRFVIRQSHSPDARGAGQGLEQELTATYGGRRGVSLYFHELCRGRPQMDTDLNFSGSLYFGSPRCRCGRNRGRQSQMPTPV